MIHKLSLLLIAMLFVATLTAQDYNSIYYEINQGHKLAEQGSYNEALSRYEDASERMKFVPTYTLMKFLKVAKKAKNESLQKKYRSLIEKQKGCPAEYAHVGVKLDSLLFEDQRVRKENDRLIRYYWKNVDNKSVSNSPKFLKAKAARMAWKRTDSLNIQILLSMFEEYGFLDESKIGFDKYRIVNIVLLHFDKDTSNVVLQPIFDKALSNGQITPFSYALILDRHLYACKLPQKFYGWPMLRSDPKLSEEEINEILKLRESIGMYGTELVVVEKRGFWSVRGFSQ